MSYEDLTDSNRGKKDFTEDNCVPSSTSIPQAVLEICGITDDQQWLFRVKILMSYLYLFRPDEDFNSRLFNADFEIAN